MESAEYTSEYWSLTICFQHNNQKKVGKIILVCTSPTSSRQEQAAPPNISQSIKEDTIGRPPSLRGGLHALFHRQTQMKWEEKQRHRDINTRSLTELFIYPFQQPPPFAEKKWKTNWNLDTQASSIFMCHSISQWHFHPTLLNCPLLHFALQQAPFPGSLLPLSSCFLAQWSLSCLSFRRIMPSSCKSQLVWTRHSHKTRCWRFFAKSRFPLTLPFPIPSPLWHAVLGNAWKEAVEWNCITHSPFIVCYTWITITYHSNLLSIYFKVWPLSVWDHRRGVGDPLCARPQPPVEDAGTQQRWDRSDEAKVSCNISLSLSILFFEMLLSCWMAANVHL